MNNTIERVKTHVPKIYSKEIVETLFENPYCKIGFIMKTIGVVLKTAPRYLHQLEKIGIIRCAKVGKDNLFINIGLMELLTDNVK